MTWFMTVSTALNAIGIVNVPPVLVGLDTTPFPGKAVAVNVSLAAKEVVEEAIDDSLRDLTASNSGSSSSNRSTRRSVGSSSVKPNLQIVKQKLAQKNSGVQLRNTRSTDTNDVIADIIHKITDPIRGILDKAFAPYYQFINCINLLFQIYEKQLDAIEEITWPITTFSNISSATGLSSGSDIATKLALKNKLKSKIKDFSDSIPKDLIPSDMLDTVYSALYEPLNYMYQTVSDTIGDIVNPIKNKITGIITTYVKEPLSTLISFISMAIQPAISSLPSFIQVIVKLALKKLLKVLLGTPIKFILSKVISPIEKLIDKAAKAMKNKVMEVFSSAINAVIKPLIKPIQTAITEMIPSFDMDYIEKRLTDIRDGVEEFPDIYVGVDPLHPYKKFVDINWSDSNEVACMIRSLIEDAGIPTSYTPSVIELTKVVESISFQDDSSPTPPKDPEDGPDAPEIPDDPDPVPKEDPNPTYILKKFESKEEFMPFFIQMHPPVMITDMVKIK